MLRIEIHTIRDINNEDYEEYIKVLQEAGVPIDGVALMRDKEFTFKLKEGDYTESTTTYTITEE